MHHSSPVTTLVEALDDAGRSDAPWLTFHASARTRTLTGAQAQHLARGWAAAFQDRGVRAGHRVLVLQPNGPDFVGAFFGAQYLGATAVPLAWPTLPPSPRSMAALAPVLQAAQASAVAAPPEVLEACAALGLPVVTGPANVTGSIRAAVVPTAAAFIQFTSGSTSSPKGAVISHRAAVANATAMGQALGLTAQDVGVSWLPFFHDMGLVGVLLTSLLHRFPVHVMTPAEFLLHPDRWIDRLSAVGATLTVAPNFAYELAARRVKADPRRNLSRLRAALCGSEPVLRQTVDRFEARFGGEGLRRGAIVPVYGLAENTLAVSFSRPAEPRADLSWSGRQVPSVGYPVLDTRVRISGPDGAERPEGVEGEIWVRSPSMMTGYFEQPAATAEVLRDGWLRTGDLGVLRAGALHVTGREKDLVIKGGQKFHPYDVERIAAEAVDAPPNGAAAFSALNRDTGSEELVVVVELRRHDDADPAKRIRGRLLEELGVRAERIHLVGAGDLPRTTSGKVRRRACADAFGGL